MTKRDSNILKCVAILLMLAHHLFMYADQPDFPALVYGPLLNTPARLAAFGQLSKLCVTIFVFVTAYGTTMRYQGDGMMDARAIMASSTRRWVKLLASFQLVYIIAFALCPLGGKSWFTLYSPSRLENLVFAFFDFMGVSFITNLPSYNSSCHAIADKIMPQIWLFCAVAGDPAGALAECPVGHISIPFAGHDGHLNGGI